MTNTNQPLEIWKDIPSYEGIYQASNLGIIKSLYRITISKTGIKKSYKERILKSNSCRDYCFLRLSKNGKPKGFWVHQLVAMAFLGHVPCKHKLVVNHINFCKTDNRVENLEIITARENLNRKHLSSSSKYTGVTWIKKTKKWQSRIVINGKIKHLGSFDSEIEASEHYEKALIAYNESKIKTK